MTCHIANFCHSSRFNDRKIYAIICCYSLSSHYYSFSSPIHNYAVRDIVSFSLSQIHQQVFISSTSGYRSIKSFYNEVFLEMTKDHVLSYSPGRVPPLPALTPRAGHSPHRPSPHKLVCCQVSSSMADFHDSSNFRERSIFC